MAFGAFILAFAIMHLLLFVFYPKVKENLFYSISMFSFAVVIYTSVQNNFNNSILSSIILLTINSIAVQLSLLFGLLTVYTSSYGRMPRYYMFFVIVTALFVIHTIFFPLWIVEAADIAFFIFAGIITVEIVRSVIRSIKRKDEWSWGWLIGVGFIVAILLIGYQVLILTDVVTQPLFGIYLVYVYGLVFLAITVSINLAKRMADTHLNLEKQLVQVKDLSQKTIEQERRAKEEEFARKLLEADNQRKTKELEEARKLQLSMLPKELPNLPHLDIAVYMKTATEVGGDYYDYFRINKNETAFAIGDIAGHGLSSALLMAGLVGFVRSNAIMYNDDLKIFMDKVNKVMCESTDGSGFATFFYSVYNNDTKILRFVNAGHNPPLLYKSKIQSFEELKTDGFIIGGVSNFEFNDASVKLESEDLLIYYTDGVTEFFNRNNEQFGADRLKMVIENNYHLSAKNICDKIIEEVKNYSNGVQQADDMTLLILKTK
jgi:serine phosphatase RsbU (regulator of sigma subunit)